MMRPSEWAPRLRHWLRALLWRRRVEEDLSREMALHVEMERDRLLRDGVPDAEATRRAHVAFGGVARFTEEVRDQRGTRWLDELRQDVRFAGRQFARAPVVTTTLVALLAIGIGANSVLFSVIEIATARPPIGIPANSALVRLRSAHAADGTSMAGTLSHDEVAEFRAHTEIFSGVAGWTTAAVLITPPDGMNPISGLAQFVTSGYFGVLGVEPRLGSLLPEIRDDDAAPVSGVGVVVSHAFWRGPLGGTAAVIGQSMKVGDIGVTILGVAPPGFNGAEPLNALRTSLWLPIGARPAATHQAGADPANGVAPAFFAVGALRAGVPVERASALVRTVVGRSGTNPRLASAPTSADVVPLRANNRDIRAMNETPVLIAVLGVVTLLMLAVICANVSALLIGRAMTRRREVGVRLSLGASRSRIIRQLVTESVLLAVAGAAIGLLLVEVAVAVGTRWAPEVGFDVGWRTMAATGVLAIATGVVFGLSPALHATRVSVFEALKDAGDAGTGPLRGQRRLVVAQIALSQPLLVGLGVLVAVVLQVEHARPRSGVSDRTIIMDLDTRVGSERQDTAGVLARIAEVTGHIALLPDVERVSHGTDGETSSTLQVRPTDGTGRVGETFTSNLRPIGPGYFSLLNVSLVRGREFGPADTAGAPGVLVMGADLARHLFGEADPIGRVLTCVRYCNSPDYIVVGVVDPADAGPSLADGRLHMYFSSAQDRYFGFPKLFVRVRENAPAMIPAVRALVRREWPEAPVSKAMTLAQENRERQQENIASSAAAAGGGALALLLAAIGLYAVVAHAVSQRTREIGVRIALGARPGQIVRHFFRDGIRLSLIGSAIGLPASVLAVRLFMAGIQYRGPAGWGVAGVIGLLVGLVSMMATWMPARRAARVDPMSALRTE